MGRKVSAEWPEGRPGFGEVKPRFPTRKDGTTYRSYYGCYKGPDGTRQYVSDDNKWEAKTLLKKAEAETSKGRNPKDGKVAWDKAFQDWLAGKEGEYAARVIKGKTIDKARSPLRCIKWRGAIGRLLSG
jgi:hypothetical protein